MAVLTGTNTAVSSEASPISFHFFKGWGTASGNESESPLKGSLYQAFLDGLASQTQTKRSPKKTIDSIKKNLRRRPTWWRSDSGTPSDEPAEPDRCHSHTGPGKQNTKIDKLTSRRADTAIARDEAAGQSVTTSGTIVKSDSETPESTNDRSFVDAIGTSDEMMSTSFIRMPDSQLSASRFRLPRELRNNFLGRILVRYASDQIQKRGLSEFMSPYMRRPRHPNLDKDATPSNPPNQDTNTCESTFFTLVAQKAWSLADALYRLWSLTKEPRVRLHHFAKDFFPHHPTATETYPSIQLREDESCGRFGNLPIASANEGTGTKDSNQIIDMTFDPAGPAVEKLKPRPAMTSSHIRHPLPKDKSIEDFVQDIIEGISFFADSPEPKREVEPKEFHAPHITSTEDDVAENASLHSELPVFRCIDTVTAAENITVPTYLALDSEPVDFANMDFCIQRKDQIAKVSPEIGCFPSIKDAKEVEASKNAEACSKTQTGQPVLAGEPSDQILYVKYSTMCDSGVPNPRSDLLTEVLKPTPTIAGEPNHEFQSDLKAPPKEVERNDPTRKSKPGINALDFVESPESPSLEVVSLESTTCPMPQMSSLGSADPVLSMSNLVQSKLILNTYSSDGDVDSWQKSPVLRTKELDRTLDSVHPHEVTGYTVADADDSDEEYYHLSDSDQDSYFLRNKTLLPGFAKDDNGVSSYFASSNPLNFASPTSASPCASPNLDPSAPDPPQVAPPNFAPIYSQYKNSPSETNFMEDVIVTSLVVPKPKKTIDPTNEVFSEVTSGETECATVESAFNPLQEGISEAISAIVCDETSSDEEENYILDQLLTKTSFDFLGETRDSAEQCRQALFTSTPLWTKTKLLLLEFEDDDLLPPTPSKPVIRFLGDSPCGGSGSPSRDAHDVIHNNGASKSNEDLTHDDTDKSSPKAASPASCLELTQIDERNPIAEADFLKSILTNYRRVFLHLVNTVVQPCDDKIKKLVGNILAIRRVQGDLFSLASGINSEISIISEILESNDKIDCSYWQERLTTCDSALTDIDTRYTQVQNDLSALQSEFPSSLVHISDAIFKIRGIRDRIMEKYFLFYELNDSQKRFGTHNIHQFTRVNVYKKKTLWHYHVVLEDFKDLLTKDVEALVLGNDSVRGLIRSVHDGFTSVSRDMELYQQMQLLNISVDF